MSLPRPPQRQEEPDSRRKWRTHAVSLAIGNYTELDDDDGGDEYGNQGVSYPWEEEELELSEQIQELQQQQDEQKQKWLDNAKPPHHPR